MTLGGIYRNPCCLADYFTLRYICSLSKAKCCLIIADFNATRTNWMGLTAPGRGFDSDLLSTIFQCTFLECVAKLTHIDSEHGLSFLDFVFTHHCDDIINIQYLPPPANSDYVVLYFGFRTHGIQHLSVPSRPNNWLTSIPAIRDCYVYKLIGR